LVEQLEKKSSSIFKYVNYAVFAIFALVTLYPFWDVLIGSLMPYNEYVKETVKLIPNKITLESYRIFFNQEQFIGPLFNSAFYTIVGTGLSMLVTTAAAYALSKKRLIGRNIIMYVFFFTTLFSGGIVPLYLVMKSYGLVNSIWSVILLGAVNTFYLIIMRTHFAEIPDSIEESAKMDGAGDTLILFRIMLPMSKPMLATMILFYSVDKWNDFWGPLILIRDQAKQVLQVILYLILFEGTQNPMKSSFTLISKSQTAVETLKMAAVIAVTLPILLVYPFLQKYFVKGVMIGSIKG
jgi:ABC-type sugar transport system, permease component